MRLIDADTLPIKFWFGRFFGVAEIDIVNAPTVDAVTVVRCKDCVYYEAGGCRAQETIVIESEFCSWGEKRENGHSKDR